MKYYFYYILLWLQLFYVVEDYNKKIVGYVLVKMEEDVEECYGYIILLVVLWIYCKLGLVMKFMIVVQQCMQEVFGVEYVLLYVCKSNCVVFYLYMEMLGYRIMDVEVKYYVDGEDVYDMWKILKFGKVDNLFLGVDLKVDFKFDLKVDLKFQCSFLKFLGLEVL